MSQYFRRFRDTEPFANPVDAILADIAANIQLPPGLHAKSESRYEAVRNYTERDGSPLEGRVLRFYPQGSMAIDATISTRGTDEEYDLDIVAELDIEVDADPQAALDLLHASLRGYPTAKRVERQTRCVTVRYSDGMHLDITPAVRIPGESDRVSNIFHANPDEAPQNHYRKRMNAWAFAEWYRKRTPRELWFTEAFNKRVWDAFRTRAAAEVEEVPDQIPLPVKNTATVALQLLKRFRNIVYAGSTSRIPPSVLMSCFAGYTARPGVSLSEMVIAQARFVAQAIDAASARGERVSVRNPMYPEDCFTDRWPETLAQQDYFAAKLTDLADGLEKMKVSDMSLEEMRDWLREQFGERVVSRSIEQFNDRVGRAVRLATPGYTRSGGLLVPEKKSIIGSLAVSSVPSAARPHTFYGGVKL